VGATAVDNLFRSASWLGRLHPEARAARREIAVHRDIGYAPTGARHHRLDVYRPQRQSGAPQPIVLYVHGGGFRILSKDTHWVMGFAFARAGYLVFNISYRLAPRYPFPAAVEDCARAFEWVVSNAESYGGDLGRLVLAGESAGANLALTLSLLSCYRRSEPWAARVFDLDASPRAVVPYCGVHQVSDVGRFHRAKPHKINGFLNDRLHEVSDGYLGPAPERHGATLDLADPVVWLERGEAPARALPPCFATVGTRDPLLDDTRRLQAAYAALEGDCEAVYYPGEAHAFHAAVWRPAARRCWRDTFRFLGERGAA